MAKDDQFNAPAMADMGSVISVITPEVDGAAIVAGTPHGELKKFRIGKRESQEKFWGRFGVTQSSGSRFETGLGIPPPVAILVKLYLRGRLSDGDLPG